MIFTGPEVAVVGVTEADAIAAGHRCWCNTLPISLVPRAGAIRDTRGILKMTADAESNEVLGVSMVGHNAGEVIHEAEMAMRYRATIPDFIDLLHVFPTMSEALKVVAISSSRTRQGSPAALIDIRLDDPSQSLAMSQTDRRSDSGRHPLSVLLLRGAARFLPARLRRARRVHAHT